MRGRQLTKLSAGGTEPSLGKLNTAWKAEILLLLTQTTEPAPGSVDYKFLLTKETSHPAWYIHPEINEILFPFPSLRNS